MKSIRTRFAPSPTGFLHLGSARTALFNWAFARHHGGTFVLRIEDTDHDRSTRESEAAVLEGMRWLGLDWDEGPIRQSERSGRHRAAVVSLLESGRAYRCICSKDSLEARKNEDLASGGNGLYDGRCRDLALGPDCGNHTVRIRLPREGALGFDDLVFGPSGQDASQIGDAIIQRSDGTPLYNLAVVVDDIEMGITHVIRGADHHPNTPLQVAIYRALGVDPPFFAHVPLIVGESGKKLSKRRDNVSIQEFQQEGQLHEALVNWIVRLGWSHGDDEVFSLDDIARLFDLDHVGRSAARAEPAKLQWLGQHYIKELESDVLFRRVEPFLASVAGQAIQDSPGLRRLLDALRERSHTLMEMAEQARWLIRDEIEYEEKAVQKHLRPVAIPLLTALRTRLETVDPWDEAQLERAFESVAEQEGGVKMGKLAQPTRVAVTGRAVSPGIYETLAAIGRDRCLTRLGTGIGLAEARAAAQNS
ncbi:MAG: glutamate--tRNA ligase [Myxococcota bacterium]|nr:glutamate--tRNA ligase [Myxococcota bacterium]